MKYHDGSTILPGLACPSCGYEQDAATNLTGPNSPKDGDVSICMACGEVAVFTGSASFGYRLREATPAEREMFLADPRVVKVREEIGFLRVVKPTWPRGPREQ